MNTVGEKKSNKKEDEMSQAETSEWRNGDTSLDYSGWAALRREQRNGFDQCAERQQLCKHVQYATIEEVVFSLSAVTSYNSG
jgi:hypothetical protein